MIIDSGLAQQASTFAESLNVKEAPSVEKTVGEEAQDAKVPAQQGDTVSISLEGRALAAAEESGESDSETSAEQHIETLQNQIEKIEEEIKEIQEDEELSDKEKLQQVQAKQAELMQLQQQLAEAQEELLESEGLSSGGGTSAEGFGNSVSTF